MKALVFLTLFLGLVDGRQMVELAAAEETAEIELRLDGERHAILYGGPPWKAPVVLGEELAPHRLEAIARDAGGGELGRAEQWINLPRARAEVSLLIERGEAGAEAVRIGWKAVEHEAPESVAVFLDGAAVPVGEWEGSSTRVPLPPHDPGVLHVVSAEVTFPGPVTARADAAFGAPYGDEVATELSGVAVEVEGRRKLRSVDDVGPWLRAGGETPRVVALDTGAADLYAVIDASAGPELYRLAVDLGHRMRAWRPGAARTPRDVGKGSPLRQTGMREGDRLYLVRPQIEASHPGMQLFGISQPLDVEDGGPAWQLSYRRLERDPGRPQRLSDAVATAGKWATGSNRPRALVLVLGPDAADSSRLDPAKVRGYLDHLRVPLTVFYVDLGAAAEEAAEARGLRGGESEKWIAAERARRLEEARRLWGPEVVDVDSGVPWLNAYSDLREDLSRQRILWIEGRYLPQAVSLSGAPDWLSLIGQEP